jgi:hypothetical protein
MNPTDTLDPQIESLFANRPSQKQLLEYVSGHASPFLCELIEAHMQRSLTVRMDVEALREVDQAFDQVLERSLRQQTAEVLSGRIGAHEPDELALAASEAIDLPTKLILETANGLGGIPGLCCVASASAEAPGYATTFRFSLRGREETMGAPNRIKVTWKSGARLSRPFEFTDGRWRSDIVLPVAWKTVSTWLSPTENAVSFTTDSE